MWRFALAGLAFVTAALLGGCVRPDAGAPQKPRLVVFLVVDGLPQWQVLAYRDQLAADGLRRFLDRGTWYSDAHFGHAFTVTGAGHAVLLTGAYPHRTGIIGNEWLDRASGEAVYCTSDETHTYLENDTAKLAGTSPRNLLAETVGDVLRQIDPRAKVIAVSGKDRGAIPPAGKSGVAYMYMRDSGRFASSTYYLNEHPAWVRGFNAQKPADRYFRAPGRRCCPKARMQSRCRTNVPGTGRTGSFPRCTARRATRQGRVSTGRCSRGRLRTR